MLLILDGECELWQVGRVIVHGDTSGSVVGLVEKPSFEEAPSDTALIGRYILTPDIFDVL
jgi:UTP--glucose-1-phosphate uridylyltransferase